MPEVQIGVVEPTEEEIKKQKIRDYHHNQYIKNRAKRLEQVKQWAANNHDKRNAASKRSYQKHHKLRRQKAALFRIKHRNKIRAAKRAWYVKNIEERKAYAHNYRLKYPEKSKVVRRKSYEKLKSEVFAAYGGPICKCCYKTDYEFLSIDHIDNGGNAHRRAIPHIHLYYWLRQHGYPPGFQVLCFECNFAKGRNGGSCPHTKLKTPIDLFFS